MDIISKKLDDGICKHLDDLMNLETGSDEMHKVIGDVAQLYRMRIEEKNIEIDKARLENEKSVTDNQNAFDKKKLLVDIGISAAELILPLTLYGILSYIGFAREFDGVVTSDTLKRVLNSIKSKK